MKNNFLIKEIKKKYKLTLLINNKFINDKFFNNCIRLTKLLINSKFILKKNNKKSF